MSSSNSISLGGNRNGNRTRNVFITMLLGGLWHGAAWTFVAWGAFHGLIITLTHYFSQLKVFAVFNDQPSRVTTLFKWAITFYLTLIGWVFFRAQDLTTALSMLQSMHSFSSGLEITGTAWLILLLTSVWMLLVHLMDYYILNHADKLKSRPWLFWLLLLLGQVLCLFIGEPSNEFIYFQF